MPKKRFRRIFVGLAVAIFVMSPLVAAILLRSMLDDTIRYVYHQVTCPGRTNELKIIQVINNMSQVLFRAPSIKLDLFKPIMQSFCI